MLWKSSNFGELLDLIEVFAQGSDAVFIALSGIDCTGGVIKIFETSKNQPSGQNGVNQ